MKDTSFSLLLNGTTVSWTALFVLLFFTSWSTGNQLAAQIVPILLTS